MRVLVVYAHPDPTSTVGRLRDAVINELGLVGHEVRQHDLYAENFNPVMSAFERKNHGNSIDTKLSIMPELRAPIENLRWCEAIIFVYPTWWSSQPTILKGWFDRLLVNDVAWYLPDGANRIRPLLTNIRRIVVVTTHGSSKFINSVQGEPGKRTALRSVRLMMHWRTRSKWIAFYGLDKKTDAQRDEMIMKVRRQIRRVF